MSKRQPQRVSEPDTASLPGKPVKQPSDEQAESKPALARRTTRAAMHVYESEARHRVDESISRPLLCLWEDWDKAWPTLIAELIDGEDDAYRAAGVALAAVGGLVVRVDEFRRRGFGELLVRDVPNLLQNCPPIPVPADVLGRLRMMAFSNRFHTLSPKLAAELLVSAANGTSAGELARELADAASDTRSRDAFGWFLFIRDRLLPPPGPAPAGGTDTRTEASIAVVNRDLHDIGLAEGILPGRFGGDTDLADETESDETLSTTGRDDGTPQPSSKELPLEPWALGVFAANIGKLISRLQTWHANPFLHPLTTLAKGDDPAIAKVNRRTFRDEAQPFIGCSEPAPPDAKDDEAAQQSNGHDKTLWLLGETARQATAAPQGIAWDYLRGRIDELLGTHSRTTATPPTDTALLEFLVRQGRVVVVPREVGQSLLHGLEVAADRLLVGAAVELDAFKTREVNKVTPKQNSQGRPRVAENNDKRRLWEDYEASGLTKKKFIRERYPYGNQKQLMNDLDAGRKQKAKEVERQRAAEAENEKQQQAAKTKK